MVLHGLPALPLAMRLIPMGRRHAGVPSAGRRQPDRRRPPKLKPRRRARVFPGGNPMREGKARQFASGRAIFLGYHSAMPEKVGKRAIMTKIGQGQPGPTNRWFLPRRGLCGGRWRRQLEAVVRTAEFRSRLNDADSEKEA